MTITTVFFDLDDTLYSAQTGLGRDIKERISQYVHERLGIPAARAQVLRKQYFEQYGTTLLGLVANHAVDVHDFLNFVHDLPLGDYIKPTPGLRPMLDALPVRKFIFTNADVGHVRRVLNALELDGCFDGVLDILAMHPHCKPMPESFALALEFAGEPDARSCVMIDDQPRTTRAAREQGMFSILYGASQPHPDADAVLTDLRLLPRLLDEVARTA
jgi:putative hydrolase of the HAD superfamily